MVFINLVGKNNRQEKRQKMNRGLVFNPNSYKAGYLRAPSSSKYLNLLLDILIQAVDLVLKVLGKLCSLCFQCWC